MAAVRWTDEVLDSLAVSLADLGSYICEVSKIAESNARTSQALANTIAHTSQERTALFQRMDEQQQTIAQEQQTILEHLLNEEPYRDDLADDDLTDDDLTDEDATDEDPD